MRELSHRLAPVLEGFDLPGTSCEPRPFGSGHIHDTFLLAREPGAASAAYILQRINRAVFQDPPALMRNVQHVTEHVHEALRASGVRDIERRCLTLVTAREGKPWLRDEAGEYWRVFHFIEDTVSRDVVQSTEQAYAAARAFGDFQKSLLHLDPRALHETIPDFHDTPRRYAQFESAVLSDPLGRAGEARVEIEFARARRNTVARLIDLCQLGEIPERVAHNDTKLNNVLFDDTSGEALCVIDLDTVMPGLSLYDFGDLVRTCSSGAQEDERDLSKVELRLPYFEALTFGYLEATRAFLTPVEIDHLTFVGGLITFETGLRFLTDYLLGDVYFKTHDAEQNLDRCRMQFKLVRSMERQADGMEDVVREVVARI